ncbi:Gfo/Idh/MocA family oxidoreductase [Candidatus Parcubacteria bacterium]|nr:Gfo/Idh/MocA family oxidoreductase [Candidatus Parcubacteria bacterium]
MKVALIGIGRWGTVLKGELTKVAEVKYACDSSFDLDQVWSDPEVEAVFIATPTETHFEIAQKALESGKHVFLEKPGTSSSADLEKLVNLAQEKGLKLAVGYEFPHHPAVRKVKELALGQTIKFVRLEYQKWGTFKDSIVTNLLCHDVSILNYLGIDTTSPSAHKTGFVTEADILATRFGSQAMSVINRVNQLKQRTMLVKLDDTSFLWSNNDLFEIAGEELKKIELPDTTPVAAEIKNFLDSIASGQEPLCSGSFALEVYKVIERV